MEVGLPQSELAELGWLAHFPVPISNDENKQLEMEVTYSYTPNISQKILI